VRGEADLSGEEYTELLARRAVAAAKVRVALHRYLRAPDQAPDHAGAMRTVLAHMNDLKKELRIEVRMDGKLALQETYTRESRTLVVMYNQEHWVLHSAKTWGDQWISAKGVRLVSVKRDAKSSLMAGSGRVTNISPLPTTKTHSVVEVFTDGGMSVYGATQMAEDGAPESESRLHALPLSEIRLGKIAGFVYTLQSGYDLAARSERASFGERSQFGARSSFGSGATKAPAPADQCDEAEQIAYAFLDRMAQAAEATQKSDESAHSLLYRLLAYKLNQPDSAPVAFKSIKSDSDKAAAAEAKSALSQCKWASDIVTLKAEEVRFVGKILDNENPAATDFAAARSWGTWFFAMFSRKRNFLVPMWLIARKMLVPDWFATRRFVLFQLALSHGDDHFTLLSNEMKLASPREAKAGAVTSAWCSLFTNFANVKGTMELLVTYECDLSKLIYDTKIAEGSMVRVTIPSLLVYVSDLAAISPALESLLALYNGYDGMASSMSAAYAILSLLRYNDDPKSAQFPNIHEHLSMMADPGSGEPVVHEGIGLVPVVENTPATYTRMAATLGTLKVRTRIMILQQVHLHLDEPSSTSEDETKKRREAIIKEWHTLIPPCASEGWTYGWTLKERGGVFERALVVAGGGTQDTNAEITTVIFSAVVGVAEDFAALVAEPGTVHEAQDGTLTRIMHDTLKRLISNTLPGIEKQSLDTNNGAITKGLLGGLFRSAASRCEKAKRVRRARRAMGVREDNTKKEDRLTKFPMLYSEIEAIADRIELGEYTENEKSAYLGDYSQSGWEPGNAPCFPQPIEITAQSTIGDVKACCCVDVRDPKGSNAKSYPKDAASAKALAEWILDASHKADVEKATDCAFLRYYTKGRTAPKQSGDTSKTRVLSGGAPVTEIFRVCGGLWGVDDFLILTMVTSDLPKFANALDVDRVHKEVLYGALRSVERGPDDTEKDGSIILTEKSTIREIQRYVATILEARGATVNIITDTDINDIEGAYRLYLGVKGRTRKEIQDVFGPSYKRPWDRIRRWRERHTNASTKFGIAAFRTITEAARGVATGAAGAVNAGVARAGRALVSIGVPRSWKSALPFAGSNVGLSAAEMLASYKLLGVHQKLDHEYVRRMFGFVGISDMYVAATVGADKESIDVTLMSLDIGFAKEAERLVNAVKASANATSESSALTAKAVERAVRCGFLEWEKGIKPCLILCARGDAALEARLTAWNEIVIEKRNTRDDAARRWHVGEASSKAKGVAALVAGRLLWLVGGGMVPALSGLMAKGVGADAEVLAQLAGSLGEFASTSGVFAQESVYAPLAQITRLAHAASEEPAEAAKWAPAPVAPGALPAPPPAPTGIALAAAAADNQRAMVAVIAAFVVLYDIISPSGSAGSTANAIAEQVCALVPGLGPDVADMLELFATFSEGNDIAAGLRKAGAFADFVGSESPLASVGGGSDAERLATAMSVVGALRSAGAEDESAVQRMVRVMSLVSIVSGAQGLKWHTRMRIRADGIRQMAETMALSASVAASLDAGAPRPGDGAEMELDRYAVSIRMRDALGLLTALKKNQLFVSESHVYRATAESNRVVSAVDELIPGGYVPHDQFRDMDVFATSNQGVVASVIGNMTSWRGNVTGACLVVVTGGDARVLRDRLMRGTENGLPWIRVPGEAMDSVRVAGGSRRKERMRARSVLLVSAKGNVSHASRAQALTGPTAVLIVDHDLASWIVLAIDVAGNFAETSASIGNFAIKPNTERAFTQRVHMIMSNKEPKQCGHHATGRALGALTPAQKEARRVLDVECIKSAMLVEYRLILETVRTFGFASEPRNADFDTISRLSPDTRPTAQTRFVFWEAVANAIATAAVDAMVLRRIAKLGQGQWKDEMGPSIAAIRAARVELDALTAEVTTGMPDAEKRQIARDASDLVIIDGQTDTSLEIGPALAAPAPPRWTPDMRPFVLNQAQQARIDGKFAR